MAAALVTFICGSLSDSLIFSRRALRSNILSYGGFDAIC
jgi:hypothetical protein